MPSRYVILHHQLADGEHWDLMLEQGDILLTWQLLKEPISPSSLPIRALKIQDHRIAYLDYEGPISGDRGHVTRIDSGLCKILEQSSSLYVIQLIGDRFTGIFSLMCEQADLNDRENEEWIFRAEASQ